MIDKHGRNVMNIRILRNFPKTNFQVKRTFPSNDRNALTGTHKEYEYNKRRATKFILKQSKYTFFGCLKGRRISA